MAQLDSAAGNAGHGFAGTQRSVLTAVIQSLLTLNVQTQEGQKKAQRNETQRSAKKEVEFSWRPPIGKVATTTRPNGQRSKFKSVERIFLEDSANDELYTVSGTPGDHQFGLVSTASITTSSAEQSRNWKHVDDMFGGVYKIIEDERESILSVAPRASIGPPTNVRVQAVSNTSVVVQWDFDELANDGFADGFVVKYMHEPTPSTSSAASPSRHRSGASASASNSILSQDKWRTQPVMDSKARHLEIGRLAMQKSYAFCVLAIKQSRLGPCSDPPVTLERLRPTFVVHNLYVQYKTSQSVAFHWEYSNSGHAAGSIGFYIKQMGMKTYQDQFLEEKTLVSPGFEKKVDGSERQFLWQNLRPYMNYTFQVGVYSLTDGRVYWPRELHVQTDPTGPPFVDAPEFIQSPSPTTAQIRLSCASEEYGPINHYWLIVVPGNYTKEDVVNVDSALLQHATTKLRAQRMTVGGDQQRQSVTHGSGGGSTNVETDRQRRSPAVRRAKDLGTGALVTASLRSLDGVYITAQLSTHQMQRLYREERTFIVGDEREYEGFLNMALDPSLRYSLMTRAFTREDTWRHSGFSMPELPLHVAIAIGATVIGHARISEVFSKFQNALERGQILPKSELTETWQVELVHNNVKYGVLVNRFGSINFLVYLNGSEVYTEVRELGNGTLLVTYSDLAYTCHLEEEAERFKVCIGKTLTIFEKENDPSMLRSVNAGRLLQFLRKDGEYVNVGDVYAEIESMKMVINLEVRKAGGRLAQVAQPGQVLFPGTLIARLDDQDVSASSRPTVFDGRVVEWDDVQEQRFNSSVRLNSKFESVIQSCHAVMDGYSVPEMLFRKHTQRLLNDLFSVLNDGKLPYALFKVMLNVVESRISRMSTYDRIKELISDESRPFPAIELTEEMESYLSTVDPSEVGIEKQYFEALLRICERFEGGLQGHMKIVFTELLEKFFDTESYFQDVSYDTGVSAVKANDPELSSVVRKIYSHTQVLVKNGFLRELILRIDQPMIVALQPVLRKLCNLFNPEIEPLALCIRLVLNKMHETSYGEVCSNMTRKSSERSLGDLVRICSAEGGDTILKNFVNQNGEGDLILHEFFFTSNAETNKYAIKLFIKRNFHVPDTDIEVLPTNSSNALIFKFIISPSTPMYGGHRQKHRPLIRKVSSAGLPLTPASGEFVYFLSVLSELDLLRHQNIIETLKRHSSKDAHNTFLFVAYPRGENGFNKASTLPEAELRVLGRALREEVGNALSRNGVSAQVVDLMLSRPSHPPLYTQYDFSAKEKLELYRLPAGTEDIVTKRDLITTSNTTMDSTSCSPYLLFRHNDHDIMRVFVRCLLRDVASVFRNTDKYSSLSALDLLKNKLVDLLDGACGEIHVNSVVDKSDRRKINDCNHVFIRLDYDPTLNTKGWWTAAEKAIKCCEKFLVKHRVTKVEIIYQESHGREDLVIGQPPDTIRIVYINETGVIPEFCVYKVVDDKLQPITVGRASLTGQSFYAPHRPIPHVQVQRKRYQASKTGTTYVYDFPIMFGQAVLNLWKNFKITDPMSFAKLESQMTEKHRKALQQSDPSAFVCSCEMIVVGDSNGVSEDDDRNAVLTVCRDQEEMARRSETGGNDRGMVAWEMELWTPNAPRGRKIVVISNDITYQIGSFSMREHRLYHMASKYSRKYKMPRVYLAANSGARIGFANDVKKKLNIVWNDPQKPEDGYKFLSVDADSEKDAVLEQIEYTKCDNNYRIDAIIGKENDIGVENLVGSGLIAGETSAAYREVPTYCLVTGRAVGIGAYAARLSHRVCQVDSSHLILTGASALNSILGREIYTSNAQLGGPQIMYRNGVSHAVASNDLDGVQTIIRWISYLPLSSRHLEVETTCTQPHSAKSVVQPLLETLTMQKDDGARPVRTQPTKSAYDPRQVLDPPEGGGLFDVGTFDEIMAGWARTIIAGRARLRGLPVSVISVETRTVECEIPADPAQEDSQARVIHQAGQVWHSNSAYKTAEAINDFNAEGLPLIVLANIRGFSGGQKDMFEMVLKFGACIVDALQSYTQPIVVYIPPYGELRGGAWAVLDSKINPTCMRMIADPDSRGGVIEPSGIVEIKFRMPDLKVLMTKSDEKLRRWSAQLASDDGALDKSKREELRRQIEERQEYLTPIFRTAVTKFADLHDTTARMLAKGAILDEVSWWNSRDYIYELLCVEMVKMTMARRYLCAAGLSRPRTTSDKTTLAGTEEDRVTIDELTIGYKWVEEHLRSVNVTTHRDASKAAGHGGRTRYAYTPRTVLDYADSMEFRRALDNVSLQCSKSTLLSKLNGDENAKSAIVREILCASSAETREQLLLDQLGAMGAEARKRLINSFIQQQQQQQKPAEN